MTEATIDIETARVAHGTTPRRRPTSAARIALYGARLILICPVVMLGVVALASTAANLAAIGPVPLGGPTPGFP